jgi:hypothetical protein
MNVTTEYTTAYLALQDLSSGTRSALPNAPVVADEPAASPFLALRVRFARLRRHIVTRPTPTGAASAQG